MPIYQIIDNQWDSQFRCFVSHYISWKHELFHYMQGRMEIVVEIIITQNSRFWWCPTFSFWNAKYCRGFLIFQQHCRCPISCQRNVSMFQWYKRVQLHPANDLKDTPDLAFLRQHSGVYIHHSVYCQLLTICCVQLNAPAPVYCLARCSCIIAVLLLAQPSLLYGRYSCCTSVQKTG